MHTNGRVVLDACQRFCCCFSFRELQFGCYERKIVRGRHSSMAEKSETLFTKGGTHQVGAPASTFVRLSFMFVPQHGGRCCS